MGCWFGGRGVRIQDVGFRVEGSRIGCTVSGLGLRVRSFGFRVKGAVGVHSDFRVQVLGVRDAGVRG